MHQLIDKKNKIIIYLVLLIILSTTSNKPLELEKNYFNTVKKFYVSGLSNNSNLLIEDKLNKMSLKNVFFVNKQKIKKVISQYSLVDNYTVKKIYPLKINIEIVPTKIVARLSGNNQLFIGSNGKLIENESENKKFPLLFGKFNSKKFLEFKNNLENSKFKFINLKSIFFFPSNRWDILTIDDILIKLPENGLDEALRVAYNVIKNDQFKNDRIIDLRITNFIITKNEQ